MIKYLKGLFNYYKPPDDYIPDNMSQPPNIFKHNFNKNFIISNTQFEYEELSVQDFLANKNSFLADFETTVGSAAQIIHAAALNYKINPKLLLIALERENGYISLQYAPPLCEIDWAMNIGWSEKFGGIATYEGFEKQVHIVAKEYRRWYNHCSQYNKSNKELMCSDDSVVPVNNATYSLYKVCPYVGDYHVYQKKPVKDGDGKIITTTISLQHKVPFGNYLSYLLWKKWWPKDFKGE